MAIYLTSGPTAYHNTNHMSTYNLYNSSAQTPISSANATPTDLSPVSPRTSTSPTAHNQAARQLRPHRIPNYVPAVLRPTDNPSRHRPSKSSSSNSISTVVASSVSTPITPPSSNESSFDSKEGQRSMEEMLHKRFLASEGITRVVTDEWNDDALEDVTGYPTRNHWKPNSSSPLCDSPICSVPFSLLRRRHHCRRCGNIYCWDHSAHVVPLDQHARFHPDGNEARACESCWSDFTTWRRRRGERGSTSNSDGNSSNGTATPIPGHERRSIHTPSMSTPSLAQKGKDFLVGSVPRDWNWSTF